MAEGVMEEIGARLTLKNRPEFSREAEHASTDVRKIGRAAEDSSRRSHGAFGRMTGAFGSMAQGFMRYGGLAAGALGIGGVTAAMYEGFKGAMDYQKIQAQTAAVLRSTRGAAGLTAKDVDALSLSISRNSEFSQENITKGENLLLTFTGIRNQAGKNNDIFSQTTHTMSDMAQALGEDTFSAALQLGKALNEPVRGVNALRRVGVSFTADQIKQIKTLASHGKALQAQKLMLGELNREFGGSAKAAGETFAGSIQKAKHAVGEFMRDLMMPVLPGFAKAITWATTHVLPGMEHGLHEAAHVLSLFVGGFKSGDVEPVHSFFGFVKTAGAELGNFFQALFHGSTSVAPEAQDSFTRTADTIRHLLTQAKRLVTEGFHLIWGFTTKYLLPSIRNVMDFLRPGLIEAFREASAIIITGFVAAFAVLGPVIKATTGFLKDHKTLVTAILIPILALVVGLKVWTAATKTWTTITKYAKDEQNLFNRVMAMNPYLRIALLIIGIAAALVYAYKHSATFRHIVQGALNAVKHAAQDVWGFIKKYYPLLAGILFGPFGFAVAEIIKHWKTVKGFFTGLPGVLKGIGNDIVQAIYWPFKTAFNLVADAWNNTAGKLHFHIPHWVPKIGGEGFSMPTIPKLHMGGEVMQAGLVNIQPNEEIVSLPTGAQVVPLKEEDRRVVPAAARGGGEHDDHPHVFQVVLDGKVIAESTYKHARDKAARR